MRYSELEEYLKNASKETKFEAKLGEEGGFIEFGNSTGKAFTLGLSSFVSIFNDILANLDKFNEYTRYDEKKWRDLGAEYYTDKAANSMSTVQSKPLFLTMSKLINWANPEIPEEQDKINISSESLNKTLEKLKQVIDEYRPEEVNQKTQKEECVVQDGKINVFAKKVLLFLNEYDKLESLLPHIKSKNEHNNVSMSFEGKTLTSIFKISDRELRPDEYTHGGFTRNFDDYFSNTKIAPYIYISTEWTAKDSRLALDNFISMVLALYPEFVYRNEDGKYCLGYKKVDGVKEKTEINETVKGSKEFKYKNILLKGVPGTGKSHLIDKIIKEKLGLQKSDHNVLRVNIHSASSNADLMQGIGIGTHEKQIIYHEKQGLILNHIRKAITAPLQPFVIVLEEIQENSLNELIGDLIYLIEESKRTVIDPAKLGEYESLEELIDDFIQLNPETYYVEIPYLVSTETKYKKMILPDNLYIFCTSNYRDDKKVIEDNLLRRFEVIEVYPAYEETLKTAFKNVFVSNFLKKLNSEVVKHFQNSGEIHPDRFMIGHAIWLDVNTKKDFYAKLLKVVTEFKDIKELDYESDLKRILQAVDNYPFGIVKTDLIKVNYKDLIEYLQNICYSDLFGTSVEGPEAKEIIDTAAEAGEEAVELTEQTV